jgi:surface antigen
VRGVRQQRGRVTLVLLVAASLFATAGLVIGKASPPAARAGITLASSRGEARALAPLAGAAVAEATATTSGTVSYQNLGYPWYEAPAVDVSQYDWGYPSCPSNDSGCFALASTSTGASCSAGTSGCFGEADPWAYYLRNCTSFVAWYLANHNVPFSDFNFSSYGIGDGGQWLQDAQSSRWNSKLTTGSTPEIGSVAVSVSNDHVMVVTGWNPTSNLLTVEEYNYDENGDGDVQSATPAAMGVSGYIYYNNVPGSTTGSGGAPPNGAFVSYLQPGQSVANDYIIGGGAPLYISNWSVYGGPQPTEALTASQWASLSQFPANGTFVSTASPNAVYVFAGGAPIYVSNWSAVGGPQATTEVDPYTLANGDGAAPILDHVHAYPANGTFVVAYNSSAQQVGAFVIAGGSGLPVSSCSILSGCPGAVSIDDWDLVNAGNAISHLNAVPSDATVVEGLPSSNYWEFIGGTRQAVRSSSSAVEVNDSSVSSFPQGPTLTAVTPPVRGERSARVTVTLAGTGFQTGATVSISGRGVTVGSAVITSPSSMTITLSVGARAKVGARTLTVTNPDGASASCSTCFNVTAVPRLNSASPSSLSPGAQSVEVVLAGSGFQSGAIVAVAGGGVLLVSVDVIDGAKIELTLTVASGAMAGVRTITVTNPDGGTVRAGILTIS